MKAQWFFKNNKMRTRNCSSKVFSLHGAPSPQPLSVGLVLTLPLMRCVTLIHHSMLSTRFPEEFHKPKNVLGCPSCDGLCWVLGAASQHCSHGEHFGSTSFPGVPTWSWESQGEDVFCVREVFVDGRVVSLCLSQRAATTPRVFSLSGSTGAQFLPFPWAAEGHSVF